MGVRMVYDLIKILKKCLKFWYVFVGTLLLMVSAMFIFVRPITTYKGSFNLSINFVDKKQVISDTGDIDYFESLSDCVVEIVKEFYLKDNANEINEKFKTTGKLRIKISCDDFMDIKMFKIEVSHPNKDISTSVLDYLATDFVGYVNAVAQQEVPYEYQGTGSFKLYNEMEPIKSLQDEVVNLALVSVAIVVVEIIIFSVLTLKNNKIEFEGELKTDFNADSLIKNYNKNIEQVEKVFKANRFENIIFIGEDVDYAKRIFKNLIGEYTTYKINEHVNDLEFNKKNIVIEVVKGETRKSDIEKLITEFNKINFNNYYFITRNKEKQNENSSNK